MSATETHNEIELRPPHGARFASTTGASVLLQFQRGKESEVFAYLREWLDKAENGSTEFPIDPIVKVESDITPHQVFKKPAHVVRPSESKRSSVKQGPQQINTLSPEQWIQAGMKKATQMLAKTVQCEGCGTMNENQAAFCNNCGISVLRAPPSIESNNGKDDVGNTPT
jgi:hypothetical protein